MFSLFYSWLSRPVHAFGSQLTSPTVILGAALMAAVFYLLVDLVL